jgi:hypothetical protein
MATNTRSDAIIAGLRHRLRQVRQLRMRRSALRGLAQSVLMTAVVAAVLLAVESLAPMSAPVRTVAVIAGLLALAAVVLLRAVIPLLKLLGILPMESDLETAGSVGRHLPELQDRIVNALQLYRDTAGNVLSGSVELVDAALEDLTRQLEPMEFLSTVPPLRLRGLAAGAGALVALLVLVVLLLPETLGASTFRLIHFTQEFVRPPAFTLLVTPGDGDIIRGADVEVRVRAIGDPPEAARLELRPAGQVRFEEVPMVRGSAGEFHTTLTAVRQSLEYRVSAADQRSRSYRLRVVDRPTIHSLRVRLEFPPYSRLAPRQLDDNVGDVLALKGTVVRFRVEASASLGRAELVLDENERRQLEVSGAVASGSLRLERDRSYRIYLQDTAGVINADPVEYRLRTLPDRAPAVAIEIPGEDLNVTETSIVGLVIRIEDDYGFTALRLVHRLVHSRYEAPQQEASVIEIPLPANVGVEAYVPLQWDLHPLLLASEDVVEYYAEVLDNDRVSGPKRAVSETYRLRLPSLEEILADAERDQEASLGSLQNALQEAEQARQEFEKLRREMMTRPDQLEWEDRQRAENMVQQYQSVQQQVEETLERLGQMTEALNERQLLSPETLEKFTELQSLMEEMNSPEFQEAMRKLQQAMQNLDPEQVRQAMENLSLTEESFRRSIERTINLLKRIQIEQRLDAMVRQMDRMLQEQQALRAEAEDRSPEDAQALQELLDRQEELRRQTEALRDNMDALQQMMEQFPGEMPLEEMQAARDSLSQSGLEEQLRQVQEQLQAGAMPDARRSQEHAAGQMQAMRDQLSALQDALRANQQQQIANAMRRGLQDMLELSRRQEGLRQRAEGLERGSSGQREAAQQQMEIMRDLAGLTQRLGALSQKTFGITPEMGKAIGDAQRSMSDAIGSLERRDARTASGQQKEAMGSLNEAAQMLQWSLNAMMQGGQGMGMAGFMQRLEQLSGQQQGINQGTRSLGGLTQEQAAALSRLAGEQAAARRSLEELAREAAGAGELSKLLGDLTRIAQEMREVQTDLATGAVNPETLQMQERILSRLLESQRSLRERDFERRRRAESGVTRARPRPAELDAGTAEGRDRLRRDLLKALEEGYARDFQALIRKYFQVLDNEQ